MKKLINSLFIGLFLVAFSLQSCNNANCDRVDCGAFGDCVELDDDTTCRCESGFEKDAEGKCNIKSGLRFVGNWNASETRFDNNNFTQETLNYQVSISEDDSVSNRVRLSNLGDLDNSTCGFSDPISLLARVSIESLIFVEATYCPNAQFSGYQITGLDGLDTISDAEDRIRLNFRLAYTDSQGNKDFDCDVVLERQ